MSESRAPRFNDLIMLPPGELREEVPTGVMWGYLRVLRGPRHCPYPGIRRGVLSEPWLTVCIPPSGTIFLWLSQHHHLPPPTPKACPSHLALLGLLALLPGLGSGNRSFIHAFICSSIYA